MQGRIRTFKQYAADLRRRKVTEYGISHAEAAEFYPDGMLRPQWWAYVEEAFNCGADFTPQAVAGLSVRQIRDLSRTTRGLRDGLPVAYLRPRSSGSRRVLSKPQEGS